MRLWHKDLVPYLPTPQLISQWRECCLIARTVSNIGTPNHILVNKIMDYPISHLYWYTQLVLREMNKRKFRFSEESLKKFLYYMEIIDENFKNPVLYDDLFCNWHNHNYMDQCASNLQEKYECGGIKEKDYEVLCEFFKDYL